MAQKKMKKYIIIAFIGMGTLIAFLFFGNFFKSEYYILLKKDGIIANYDKFNRPNGSVTVFKNGIVQKVMNFRNGKNEGWSYVFYPNGQIDNKRYYHLGGQEGSDIQYYEDGKLKYTATLKNNKRIGSFYLYSKDGKLDSYSCFDISGNPFCTFHYDSQGEVTKLDPPISSKIYSIDTKTDTITLLKFEEKNQNIRDLYVMVATPPNALIEISVNVNGRQYNDIKVIDNVIRIKNAFPKKGLNNIFMTLSMFYRNQKIIDKLNADLSVIRE